MRVSNGPQRLVSWRIEILPVRFMLGVAAAAAMVVIARMLAKNFMLMIGDLMFLRKKEIEVCWCETDEECL